MTQNIKLDTKKGMEKSKTKHNIRMKEDTEYRILKKEENYLRKIKRLHNLEKEDYYKLKEKSKDLCMICYKPETRKDKYEVHRLTIDHCHTTGKIRGLLCHKCNKMLGLAGDGILTLRTLRNALRYLRNNKEDK